MFLNTYKPTNLPIDNTHIAAIHWDNLKLARDKKDCLAIYDYLKTHNTLINHIFSISPFLSQNIIKDIDFYNTHYTSTPEAILENILQSTKNLSNETDQTALMRELRICKRRFATLCGIMDISNIWSVMDITKHLSTFASIACHSALNHCLFTLQKQNIITLNTTHDPASTSGFCILGMGKLGGEELNYSSDIDLIAFYDMDKIQTDNPDRFREKVVRSIKSFITILEHQTADGYVFRTDFRLRPNPSMTPVMMSKTAMLQYYETMGLNWERSAMIKARPVAGDINTGNAFLHDIRSFIWRKNLDFMALEDIYSIKNKINTHRSNFDLKLLGHNVKLGIGGIREIEFFAQSQQLIWGGRITDLRSKKTLETLNTLVQYDHIELNDANTLKNAYLYHRKLEHRLQMLRDEQTHTLPTDMEKMQTVAHFMGYTDMNTFSNECLKHFTDVAKIYTNLFKDKNIGQNKPQKAPIQYTKFKDNNAVQNIIDHWQSGAYRATRSDTARQLLNHLEHDILNAFEQTANPDETLALFDQFLEKLPAGVQLFSLFKSNPMLLNLLANIMGNAPRLADRLVSTPNLLDSLISGHYKNATLPSDQLNILLQNALQDATDYQDVLEITRQFKLEHFFEQGIRLLEGHATPHGISNGLSRIADVVLQGLIPNSLKNMKFNAGELYDGSFAILAFGKLGGREMTHRSDVDLVFIYDHPNPNAKSSGKRALVPTQYYTSLCQRIITGISSMTGSGHLFEADMRLRPHGNSGAMATNLDSFKAYYYTDQAWTWEKMALTRARVLYSSTPQLKKRIETIIHDTLCTHLDEKTLFGDVSSMRRKMQDEFYDDVKWFIKHRPGGLIDVEFIAQTLQLQHAHAHPEILNTNTMDAYVSLHKHKIIDDETYKTLTDALVLWHNIQGIIRLTTKGRFYEENATTGQLNALLKSTEEQSIEQLHRKMDILTDKVRTIFTTLLQRDI